MSSYDEIKKLRESMFDCTNPQDIIDDVLYDKRSNDAYMTSIKNMEFNNTFNKLPTHLQPKNITLLDKMKTQNDDLGLPLGLPLDNQLSLYNGNPTLGENAFANQSLIPLNTLKNTNSNNTINKHSDWKLQKIVLGHTGQVHCISFDPLNKFYITGSSDRTIKIWNLASSKLQLTLTGHIMSVRDLKISNRHPLMFSCSEDKTVKCWDLEKNKIVRDYHGHLSSVYTLDIHPTLDLIVTAGRDSAVRVWDIRTKLPIYTLTGHKSTVNKVSCRSTNPQIISCSMDSTIRTWDLISGKCMDTLTYHSKSVRSFSLNSNSSEFISGSSDGLKKFSLPNCNYLQDLTMLPNENKLNDGNLIINTISSNNDGGVVYVGCDNGQFGFYDWDNGELFQNDVNKAIPGSLAGENGILCSEFDHSGLRLITGGVDKSIKVWKQVDEE
ncbi:hypothetical protein CANARDRAFT_30170 [[Candida] arabinofermentans NRRL YB-2248]|uniref:Pre-mRNA-splicing factor PRP46 n=1 Tax=[Candida] arabinofermentans NRRL YB-2248 TaxID=983967 RepID=A0A1E4SUQ3_9ASCO|nr:hypothetical protein CANARDRAFT_30170 [[Candida] arabinofermentans NRRL YB-2248]